MDTKSEKDVLNALERKILEHLKVLRLVIAEEKNVDVFIIFHNSVLHQMVKDYPITKEDMLKIKGIAEKKYNKYGYKFLARLNEILFNI